MTRWRWRRSPTRWRGRCRWRRGWREGRGGARGPRQDRHAMNVPPTRLPPPGPPRDFVGYGRTPPQFRWPDGSAVAVNIVLNYEEGAEYSLLDGDPINDSWGETASTVPPAIRDMG